ncbi:MAG TPA: PilZ domain-containing protein [Nitrospirota bacterium]|nr:PilZ domain-containing protein [Nitrospirota bacterium]
MQQDKRRYKRYKLELVEVSGRMSLADKVEIIDVSLGGVSLRVDRRLNPGREYVLKLGDKLRSFDLQCIVVRSELSGIEEKITGERVMIYTAGMRFKESSSSQIAEFFKSIELAKKETLPSESDRRSDIRFVIHTPGEKILNYPAQFKVKDVSLCGALIQTDVNLTLQSVIPMELAVHDDNFVHFKGRVASTRMYEVQGEARYDIGVEFSDLSEEGAGLLKSFIDYLAESEKKTRPDEVDA